MSLFCLHADLPSFVSGDLLVCFDPHAAFLPGVSPAQPGIKIRFPSSPLLEHFPDSFAPYRVFGCDMASSLNATLFRFPLRTSELAAVSDIKASPYTSEDVLRLFTGFRKEAEHALLFLKSLRRVELWSKESVDSQPSLVFSVEARPIGAAANHPQQAIAEFVKSASSDNRSEFYKKLANEAKLPLTCSALDVCVMDPGSGGLSEQRWMVCNLLARGSPLRMALNDQGSQRGWVPWAGVAAVINPASCVEGRAFCFLPLPAFTRLPVHVNGFFELSSNRRDLWNGAGLAGDAKQRAEWNVALLTDGVSAAYVEVLVATAQQHCIDDTTVYYSLWPAPGSLPEPWEVVSEAFYKLILDKAVLRTRSMGGGWVPPSKAVFLLPSDSAEGPSQQHSQQQKVATMLLRDGVPIVENVPSVIINSLLRLHPALGASMLSPAFFRRHLGATGTLPGLHNDGQHEYNSEETLFDCAISCLEYCLSDAPWENSAVSLADLNGVPLIPMVDRSLRSLHIDADNDETQPLLVPTAADDIELFRGKLASRIIDVHVNDVLDKHLIQLAKSNAANVCMLDYAGIVDYALPAYLPPEWRGKMHVPYDRDGPTEEWIAHLWRLLVSRYQQCQPGATDRASKALSSWPLLPAIRGGEKCLSAPHPAAGLVSEGGWTESTGKALEHFGCVFVSPAIASCIPESLRRTVCISPATGQGILSALVHLLGTHSNAKNIDNLGSEERDGLRAFLLQARWFSGPVTVESQQQLDTLKGLPIFRRCGVLPSIPEVDQFISLEGGGHFYVAPRGFHPLSALPENFVQASDSEADVLEKVNTIS